MNRLEFETFIRSFNKQPGNYTEDEILSIGCAHKTLPLKDKNWNELAKKLGLTKSGNAYRCFVKNNQKRLGTLPIKDLSDCVISSTCECHESDDLENKLAELYIEKTKIRDIYNAYRRTLRDEARLESLKDFISECISDLPQLKFNSAKINNNYNNMSEAVLMLSDLHIGVECDNFYNKYNLEIATKRLDKLADDVIEYCLARKVSRLTVCNLGDMIHGIIHVNARLEQQFDVIDQIIKAAELLANFLNKVNLHIPNLIYRSVLDNHSRAVANKSEHVEKENLSRLIDWYLMSRLNGSNITFAQDNLDAGLGKFKLLNSKNVVFVHGHQDSIDKSLQNFVGATEEFIHYALLGHYHSEKMKSFQGFKVFCNGSIVGTEQYALGRRLFNKPSQTLLIFEGNNILNISIDLDIV